MGWLALLSLARLCFYLGIFGFIGLAAMRGLFSSHFSVTHPGISDRRLFRCQWYLLGLSVVGVAAIVPLNAGMMLDEGLTGLTDPLMLQIAWQSTIGEQTFARAVALVLVFVFTVWMSRSKAGAWSLLLKTGLVITAMVIGWSFTRSGHSAATSVVAQLCVAVHVVMAGWWVGSFYPLIRLCRLATETSQYEALRNTLHAYGNQAALWVGLLLFSGGVLLTLLILNVSGEVNTIYLWVMGVKLLLVCVMLSFAAHHKWKLVGSIASMQDCDKVRKSISTEAVVGVLVLAVTATLTNSIGIAH